MGNSQKLEIKIEVNKKKNGKELSAQELKESETDFGLPKGFLKFIAFACNVCYDDFFRTHLFALALFTISLGTTLIPRRNKKTKGYAKLFF